MTLLEIFLTENKKYLEERQLSAKFDGAQMPRSCSVAIDSDKYVGTITHWPESNYEVQFNSCSTGDVVILETEEFEEYTELEGFLKGIMSERLK